MSDQIPNRPARKVGRLGLAIVAALAVVVGLAAPAYANFPHFKTASVSLVGSSLATGGLSVTSSASASAELPDLLFTWTEVGLGNPGAGVDYAFSTFVTATFGCVNGGSRHPSATNKTTITEPVRATGTRNVDKNGQITDSFVVPTSSVSAPTGFSCPTGQTLAALSATFTNNTITDLTNGVTATDEDISVTLGP
jgi:hypothetical protein